MHDQKTRQADRHLLFLYCVESTMQIRLNIFENYAQGRLQLLAIYYCKQKVVLHILYEVYRVVDVEQH